MDHVIKHKLLADDQHGFVPGRNCITQLLLCLEEWTKFVEEGEAFDVIYTDFSKAFDSVAHKRLLIKLERIGITGDLLWWIRSLLSDRTQCVNVEGVLSGWKDVERCSSRFCNWSHIMCYIHKRHDLRSLKELMQIIC